MKPIQFTIRDLLWLLVVIALVLARRIDRSRVPQWEYRFTSLIGGGDGAVDLDKLGAEGWEACAFDFRSNHPQVLLKRQKR
jgi:hypothetical protein